MTPKKLNARIVTLITARLVDEYHAFHQYQAASNWCRGAGYAKAGEFFLKESDDELVHARKIQSFLTDWNITVSLPNVAQPQIEFKSLVEVIEVGYAAELALYDAYNEICGTIEELDSAVYQFLTQFLTIQTESVAQYSDMLNLLQSVEPTKINLLLLEKKLFG